MRPPEGRSGSVWARPRPRPMSAHSATPGSLTTAGERRAQPEGCRPDDGKPKEDTAMTALDMDVKEGVDSETVDAVRSVGDRYKHGWSSDVETEFAPKGLNEDIVRLISEKKNEPEWMLEWRLEAFRRWLTQPEPDWAMLEIDPIDYQEQYYYAQPVSFKEKPKSLDEVDPEL